MSKEQVTIFNKKYLVFKEHCITVVDEEHLRHREAGVRDLPQGVQRRGPTADPREVPHRREALRVRRVRQGLRSGMHLIIIEKQFAKKY